MSFSCTIGLDKDSIAKYTCSLDISYNYNCFFFLEQQPLSHKICSILTRDPYHPYHTYCVHYTLIMYSLSKYMRRQKVHVWHAWKWYTKWVSDHTNSTVLDTCDNTSKVPIPHHLQKQSQFSAHLQIAFLHNRTLDFPWYLVIYY